MQDIRAYAQSIGLSPGTIIQRSGCGNGGAWGKWERGDSSPTMVTADKLRAYMADNPPKNRGAA